MLPVVIVVRLRSRRSVFSGTDAHLCNLDVSSNFNNNVDSYHVWKWPQNLRLVSWSEHGVPTSLVGLLSCRMYHTLLQVGIAALIGADTRTAANETRPDGLG